MIEVKQIKYTRLDKLKEEKAIIEGLKCLRFDVMEKAIEHYDREINAIEIYHSPNPTYVEMVEE